MVSYLSVVLSLCIVGVSATTVWDQFESFRERYAKVYHSVEQIEERYGIFRDNMEKISQHNSRGLNFTMSMNQFGDMTEEEFSNYYRINNFQLPSVGSSLLGGYGCKVYSADIDKSLSESLSWVEKGKVTSVKDQGQCGSCWSFSATGAIESVVAIAGDELTDLSEQQMVDCAVGLQYGSHGCNGGQMDGGFKYVIENGQCSLGDYPYTSGTTKSSGTCRVCDTVATISGCYDVPSGNQLLLKQAVAMNPVSVAIEADTKYFQFYSGGILDSSSCGTSLDHGVLVVGYGEDDGVMYWLVKNSWSSSWGDQGYVKILRSESEKDAGICGIGMQPSFPEA